MTKLRAPFPYAGGKSRIADIVWRELGDPYTYIEPFCGSAAVLLSRPEMHNGKREVIGDLNGYVCNAFRAMQYAPEQTARHAWWPTFHADLTARHRALVQWGRDGGLAKLQNDPDYYDCRIAGWWIWGVSSWISITNFCKDAFVDAGGADRVVRNDIPCMMTGRGVQVSKVVDPSVPKNKPPSIGPQGGGRGVQVNRVGNGRPAVLLTSGGNGVQTSRVDNGMPGSVPAGLPDAYADEIDRWIPWFILISKRLARTHVLNLPWDHICRSDSITGNFHNQSIGVYLDPPYKTGQRQANLYAQDNGDEVADAAWQWAKMRGADPNWRIVVSALEGDYTDIPDGWRVEYWRGSGGPGGGGQKGKAREMILISPHCVGLRPRQSTMF